MEEARAAAAGQGGSLGRRVLLPLSLLSVVVRFVAFAVVFFHRHFQPRFDQASIDPSLTRLATLFISSWCETVSK